MEYVQFNHFKEQLHTMAKTDKVCQVLLDMFQIVTGSNHTWTAARLQWMRRVLNKDIRVCSCRILNVTVLTFLLLIILLIVGC
jgi:hypothetical protein